MSCRKSEIRKTRICKPADVDLGGGPPGRSHVYMCVYIYMNTHTGSAQRSACRVEFNMLPGTRLSSSGLGGFSMRIQLFGVNVSESDPQRPAQSRKAHCLTSKQTL